MNYYVMVRAVIWGRIKYFGGGAQRGTYALILVTDMVHIFSIYLDRGSQLTAFYLFRLVLSLVADVSTVWFGLFGSILV